MEEWIKISPAEGTAGATVKGTVTAEEHTGREERTGTIAYKPADDGSYDGVEQTVTQEAAEEFITPSATTLTIDADGGDITLAGTSNGKALTFTPTGGAEAAANYDAAGISTANGGAIDGDPGASGAYDYSCDITIPENTATEEQTYTVEIATAGGKTATVTITQAAAEAYIMVSPTTLTFDADGGEQEVEIEANVDWVAE